jgi:hypothetical protein
MDGRCSGNILLMPCKSMHDYTGITQENTRRSGHQSI